MILEACTFSLKRDWRWLLFLWPLPILSQIMWTWNPHWKRYDLGFLLAFPPVSLAPVHFYFELILRRFILRIRSSSWWTQFSARNHGTPFRRPLALQALLPLSPATASTCPSLSTLRAPPLCLTANQPFRYRCWSVLCSSSFSSSESFFHWPFLIWLFHSCLLPMSCLSPWPPPAWWWNRPMPSPQRASFSAKRLSHLTSKYNSKDIHRIWPFSRYITYYFRSIFWTLCCCFYQQLHNEHRPTCTVSNQS